MEVEAEIVYEDECGICREEYKSDSCLGHWVDPDDPEALYFDDVAAHLIVVAKIGE